MLTLRKKIAQMLIMGFAGTEITIQSPVAKWLTEDGLGGVLLFDKDLSTGRAEKNLVNLAQIHTLLAQLQHLSMPLPLLTAIDYEGGAVDRLRNVPGCKSTISPAKQGLLSDQVFDIAITQMAETLEYAGFNLNFAPVVDLNLNEEQGIIGKLDRCFSSVPEKVAHCAARFVEIFNQKGLIAAYKHFPGHGSATGDTHTNFVDVTDTWQPEELIPYQMLVNHPTNKVMIMTAHVVNRNLDPSGLPASLSETMLTGLLRKKLGFQGVIVSDDLQMQAITNHYKLDEALRLSVNAGADMLIFGNQLGSITATEVVDRLEKLVNAGDISENRIDEAYERIQTLKQFLIKTPCDLAENKSTF